MIMSGHHYSPLLRGHLEEKNLRPASWKARSCSSPGDQVFYKSVAEQLVYLNDTEDIQEEDAVEGDDIFQVLLTSFHHRAGRRQYSESDTEEEDQLERDKDILLQTRWSRGKLEENIHETQRLGEVVRECIEQAYPPNSQTILRWVGTLLLGSSILLTWPIGLAYLQD
ncbi:hypothetical protein PC129_g1898 [Phytophthora cactorum]|uniref:Uncharacterized protein n=2 Tax=Phytophthora cactorum TaxID=29920 RepID=A0A8T1K1U4_9STRA|nr:hypothetical protein Pcac1_g27652 [Phytophthora cactorum]KAG2806357.1 hypothetical protein PC112_g17874 [Phytophthora cactorum]KAG2808012.1 hypothetical protein PC111_g16673 [Phytophthora cactorum]KAG2865635.1 hypothetical protein PC113_g3504 [Phytophthora cactorum]KAG2912011.1 hypothetical protein PC117_g19008 [Phytophthora cactorum]